MTGALGAVAKTEDEPKDNVQTIPALDPEESQTDLVDVEDEPCQRCGDGPREELVEISMRDCIAIFEVCRPCARRLTDSLGGGS